MPASVPRGHAVRSAPHPRPKPCSAQALPRAVRTADARTHRSRVACPAWSVTRESSRCWAIRPMITLELSFAKPLKQGEVDANVVARRSHERPFVAQQRKPLGVAQRGRHAGCHGGKKIRRIRRSGVAGGASIQEGPRRLTSNACIVSGMQRLRLTLRDDGADLRRVCFTPRTDGNHPGRRSTRLRREKKPALREDAAHAAGVALIVELHQGSPGLGHERRQNGIHWLPGGFCEDRPEVTSA